ncbi:MAG: hypothetical protein KAQ96_03850 [Thermoplasmata archaeon]|nr:hypothetical protein [Thermoplasmata archaeon]
MDRKLNIGLIGLFALIGLGIAVLLAVMPASAGFTGDAPPMIPGQDWNINNPTHVWDQTVTIWDADVNVNNKLSLHNVTVSFEVVTIYDYYDFNVNAAGSVQANDTTITAFNGMAGFYWDLYMDGNCDFDRVNLEYLMNMTTTGSLSLDDCTLTEVRESLTNTGTLSITDSDVSFIRNGIILDGTTDIDGSDFSHIYKGIQVSNDNVVVTDSTFDNLYDMGFHFIDCAAELDTVDIYISDGTAKSYWTTDHTGTWDDRFSMGMGIGIWVEGGNPSFTDVDVEVYVEAEFNVIWTGAEDTVRLYTRVLATAVLINSKDMTEVSGITAHDSYITCRGKFAASPTPFEFQVWMDAFSGGIGVVNYDEMTITGIESYDNSIGSLYVEVSGGSGYTGSRYSYQVVTAIVEDFTSSPHPSLTLENIKVSDGSYWFFHYYNPTYSGTGVPTFGNTVLVDNLIVDMALSRVLTFELKAGDSDARDFDLDTRVTNSHFEGLNSEALYYYLSPGPGIDPVVSTVDITERFSFDNSTITECYYPGEYLVIGSDGPNMPSDFWDRIVTIADNDFVDTTGMFFYSWSQWGFVKGKDQLHVLNNNMRNTASTWGGPFYADGYDTIRFIGNTLTDMTYEETGDFYDYGGDDNGVKPTDWLFKDNTFDNCTNERWSEVIFLEFGGAVVFEGNEVKNMNGLVSMMHWTEYTGSASMDIIDNKFHDNTAYFIEFGNTDPGHKNFVMTIMDNEVYGNSDYFLTFWGSDSTITSNADDGMFIIEENNFHDNDGGIINVWGNVSVVDNTFTNNVGPLLDIEYIDLHIPALSGNVLANNQDLFMLVGKDLGYQLVSVSLSDQVLTCTGTALSFYNMEVTLDGVDIIGADTSIMARNSFVDVFGSTIDGDTCMVVGDGLITTWWPLEVYATWGDIEGNDGDIPVSEALVVFNTAEGDYYSSEYAGIDGILPQNLYPEWFVDGEGVRWNSPYSMKVAAAGGTNETNVVLDKDLTGTAMVHMILWDAFSPVVAITEPFDGAILARDTLETFGFVAEVGSGLEKVEYSTDGGDHWDPITVGITGDWTLTMADLPDGEVSLMVRAYDIASNIGEAMVTINIDTTPPGLSISALPAITNNPEITITGSVEKGAKVFLNGKSYGENEDSILAITHTLHEHSNIIVVEAKDEAGNIAMETINIILDTHEPILVVTGPARGLITNADSVAVTGIVEIDVTLTIGGSQAVPDEMGRFSYDFTLASGENSIDVKATDEATNVNLVTIIVYQNQDPPYVEIMEPSDGTKTDQEIITVHIMTDQDATLWLNGRMLSETGDVTMLILLLEGENTITVRAMDRAGNEAIESVSVTRDTEPPSLVITSPDVMEIWTNAAGLDVAGIALKATSVKAGGQGADFDRTTGIFTATVPLSEGLNNVTVEASDGVNVVSETIIVWVNRNAPLLNVASVEPVVKTPSVTISGETKVGIDIVTLEVKGSLTDYPVAYDGTYAVTLKLYDDTYDIKVMATDSYGNVAEATTGSFTVKAKIIIDDPTDDEGFAVEPLHIGLILAVVGIALLVAAYASAHFITKRRREELEDND